MKEELIKFDTAVLAKEKRFDWECRFLYKSKDGWEEGLGVDYNWNSFNSCSAPTQSLLQKWLREVHNIHIEIMLYHMHGEWVGPKYKYGIYSICQSEAEWDNKNGFGMEPCFHDENENSTYEEALEEGLYEALKLIETK